MPPYGDTDWEPIGQEPLIRLNLQPKGNDFAGVFNTDYPYPDTGHTVVSEYSVSYLPQSNATVGKKVEIPAFGLTVEWQNTIDELAYLAIIAGYEFRADAEFGLADGQILTPVSTRFYYIVVATKAKPNPEQQGHQDWPTAKLTINLDQASARLHLNPDADRTQWDFFAEDVTNQGQSTISATPGSPIPVSKIANGTWDDTKRKNIFTIDTTIAPGQAVLPLGQYLLLQYPEEAAL
jgi:hypothetical protein